MVKVKITSYGNVNKELGCDCIQVELEQERVTVEDALRAAELGDGRNLFDLVADDTGVKDGYTILLNGRSLWNPEDLKRNIGSEDVVTAMDVLSAIGGG